MLKVGLTGNIGSGKSVVAEIFANLGIPIYEADNNSKKFLIRKNDEFKEFKRIKQKFLAHDKYGQLVFLADSDFTIQMTQNKYPSVKLFFTSEFD